MMLRPKTRTAFSLVEVTLALGVASFSLLAVFGLLPAGINSNQSAIEQTSVSGITRALIADIRATQSVSPARTTSQIYQIPIPAAGATTTNVTLYFREDGSVAQASSPTAVNQNAVSAQNPRYRATLSFYPPVAGRGATRLRLLMTWPALADPTASTLPANFSGSIDSVTALDRN